MLFEKPNFSLSKYCWLYFLGGHFYATTVTHPVDLKNQIVASCFVYPNSSANVSL